MIILLRKKDKSRGTGHCKNIPLLPGLGGDSFCFEQLVFSYSVEQSLSLDVSIALFNKINIRLLAMNEKT